MRMHVGTTSATQLLALLLTVGAFVFGCSGPSNDGDDDDDDDDDNSSGGVFGRGGASTGGSSSAGVSGSLPIGGTSSGGASCASICQRLQSGCPSMTTTTCTQDCLDSQAMATSAGCSAEYQAFLDCFGSIDPCNPPTNACVSELSALSACGGL